MRVVSLGLMVLLLIGTANAQTHATDGALMATFSQWASEHRVVGISAGVLDGSRTTTASGGVALFGGNARVTDSTIFEIGSITKVFTGTLLANMVLKGEVALDDPVAKYLPGWSVPRYQGREITLLDLATQSSGLPRLPDNFKPADGLDPYADYDDAHLQAFLAAYQLTRAPGTLYEYSNLGMGLLGRALAFRAGTTYEALLRSRILDPLRMTHTRITEDPAWGTLQSTGHGATFAPVKAWHFVALQGAGALRSSVSDMLKFAAALRDTTTGPLAKALAMAIRPRRLISGVDSIGLAWHHKHVGGIDVVWHNGGTAGFRSWLSADLVSHRAVVAITNAGSVSLDGVGVELLRNLPLTAPTSIDPPKEMALPAAALAKLTGRYELSPQFAFEITQRGDTLWAQATGQGTLPVFPSSPTSFFYKVVKAELLFQVDSSGMVTGLILRQNGADQPARKVR